MNTVKARSCGLIIIVACLLQKRVELDAARYYIIITLSARVRDRVNVHSACARVLCARVLCMLLTASMVSEGSTY